MILTSKRACTLSQLTDSQNRESWNHLQLTGNHRGLGAPKVRLAPETEVSDDRRTEGRPRSLTSSVIIRSFFGL